jgi:hypothetical protein
MIVLIVVGAVANWVPAGRAEDPGFVAPGT